MAAEPNKNEIVEATPELIRAAATALERASMPGKNPPTDKLEYIQDYERRRGYKILAKALRDSIRDV